MPAATRQATVITVRDSAGLAHFPFKRHHLPAPPPPGQNAERRFRRGDPWQHPRGGRVGERAGAGSVKTENALAQRRCCHKRCEASLSARFRPGVLLRRRTTKATSYAA